MLTFPEVAQLRTWAAAADLSTLKDTYTLAGGFSDPLVWRLEVGNTQSAKAVTFERYPFPTDEPGYPARLKTFVDQLMSYRPPELKPFVPDRIYVLVVERAPIKGKTSTLPPEFDPNNMEVASRSVEEVRYQAVYSGEEAAKIRALLDAGQFFYNTERRSYYVYYLPLIELPMPSPSQDWLGTTSSTTATTVAVNLGPVNSFVRELSGDGLCDIQGGLGTGGWRGGPPGRGSGRRPQGEPSDLRGNLRPSYRFGEAVWNSELHWRTAESRTCGGDTRAEDNRVEGLQSDGRRGMRGTPEPGPCGAPSPLPDRY